MKSVWIVPVFVATLAAGFGAFGLGRLYEAQRFQILVDGEKDRQYGDKIRELQAELSDKDAFSTKAVSGFLDALDQRDEALRELAILRARRAMIEPFIANGRLAIVSQ